MLTPVAKRVLIKPIEQQKVGNLIVNQKPVQFTVISVGEECTTVKAGNIVYLEKHYGVEIDYENEKYLVIDESCILAKIS